LKTNFPKNFSQGIDNPEIQKLIITIINELILEE